jgi:long-chain acyl-CoA synthetase
VGVAGTISNLFLTTAQDHQERVYLLEHRDGGLRRFTYRQVRRHVDAVAAALAARGIGPGDHVVIISPNCAEWIVAFLAILRAGAVAVPLYSELNPEEVYHLVRASRSRLVLGSDRVVNNLRKLKVPALSWPEEAPATLAESLQAIESGAEGREPPPTRGNARDLAVIIYTSGTTARPKGVMLSHYNILSNVESFIGLVDVSHNDCLLMVLPLHHAFPLTVGLIASMRLGASLGVERDVRAVATRMAEMRPTVFFGVPALYDTVLRTVRQRIDKERGAGYFDRIISRLDAVKRATRINVAPVILHQLRKRLGGRLRFMVSGGAALSPETQRGFFQMGIPLIQGYGLTEAAPAVAAQSYSAIRFLFTRHYEHLAGSVGRALPGVEVALADAPQQGLRASIHGQGELLVRGPNVMMGYFDNEEATREVIENGWLHTGDLARIDDNGYIFITGRAKDVIVLDSGENIYPEEVEEVLSRNPLLADSCLAISGGKQRNLALVVYPDTERAGLDASLRNGALRARVELEVAESVRRLAAYKRPSRIIIAAEPLPRTLLGKVKRHEVVERYLK